MSRPEPMPSAGALEEVRRLAGPAAAITEAVRLEGGQHTVTWRVETEGPATKVVVREFPEGDPAAAGERLVLRALDGLDGLAPRLLGGDLEGEWSRGPTSLIGWLDGEAEITPAGPLAAEVRARWPEIVAAPEVLSHGDFWSGNTVWRDSRLTGVVDWASGARGPRGFDLGWCRLDLVLLFEERIAGEFLAAYEGEAGGPVDAVHLWDCWAAARSHDGVASWAPNYQPLGRADLDEDELRRRHEQWTRRLRQQR